MKKLFSKKSYNIIRETPYGDLFDPIIMDKLGLSEKDKIILTDIHDIIVQSKKNTISRFIIESSSQAIEYLQDAIGFKPQEELIAIYLDTKNKIICEKSIHCGTLSQSVAHPRDILREAIYCNAARFIVAHNHPSGDPTPSPIDLEFTRRLVSASDLCGIPLLDHIIVGRVEGISIREHNPHIFD